MRYNNYVLASSLEEAYELNQKRSNRILGGNMWMRMGKNFFGTAIDLSGLGLDQIIETEEEIIMGAMVSLHQMETSCLLQQWYGNVFHDALCNIVGVQFRNGATLGGSVYLRAGFSDVITVLLALGAEVEMYKAGKVDFETFIQMPRDNDIVVNVILKKKACQTAYQAYRNTKTDFPVLNCVACKTEGVTTVAVGARPGKAVKIEKTMEDTAAFAEKAAESLTFEGNLRGSAVYRKHLCKVLVGRALMAIDEQEVKA